MRDEPGKKVKISEILNSQYVKEAGMSPNYLVMNGNKVFRVNIIGIIVGVRSEENEADIDDGSGMLLVKSFEEKFVFKNLKIGDIVLIIGKPREFGKKYLMPEVIKKVDSEWLSVRKAELKDNDKVSEVFEEKTSEKEDLLMKIRSYDDGSGAPVEMLIKENPENEAKIRELLKEGEIFQPSPDKVKVLE